MLELWQKQLSAGLSSMNLPATAVQQEQLLAYLQLLLKWNKAFNLTAIRDPQEMVSRQLLDSLSVLPYVQGSRVLDVGTGAGLPGIPLAIMDADLQVTLLDSNSKKTRFVNQVWLELGLDNIEIVHQRVAQYVPEVLFNTITSRAFATLSDMLEGSAHLLEAQGIWLAMKGQLPTQELAELSATYKSEIKLLAVPETSGQRHAIVIRRNRSEAP